MKAQEIAKIILEQINILDPAALSAYGATNFEVIKEHYIKKKLCLGGLRFKVRGLQYKGLVSILLMSDDTYTIIIGNFRTFENTYCDQLVERLDWIEFADTGRREYTSADILKSLFDD